MIHDFSWKQMFVKGCKYIVIFGLPKLVDIFIVAYPEWAQLTVGGALVMLVNLLKAGLGARLP